MKKCRKTRRKYMKNNVRTKTLSLLLTLAMLLSLVSVASLTAFAYDGNPYASLVNTTTAVKFNDIDWYIIADNSTAVDAGTVTLLAADTSFGTSKFDSANSNSYNDSGIKATLDAMTAEGGDFAGVADAIESVTLTTYKSNSTTEVSETTENAKLYLLSTAEANGLSQNVLKMNFTGGDCFDGVWWLRSPGGGVGNAACVIGAQSVVIPQGYDVGLAFGVRPALQLDLSKVEFDSETKTFTLASAAPASGNSTDVNSVVDPSYTVGIPAAVTLGDAAVTADITASDVSLESGKQVEVKLTEASNTESGSTFSAKNGDSVVTYTITGDEAISVGDTVATFAADGSQTLTFTVADKSGITVAGSHTETLTFTISVEDAALILDLATVTANTTVEDGYTIINTLAGNYKISIAGSATVTLKDVTINGTDNINYDWAGITCEGDATIILSGSNTVKGFDSYYPGINVPEGSTVTIRGDGSLNASSNGYGAGIGGGNNNSKCGNITIESGTIIATGGVEATGIGSGSGGDGACGNITITGGNVTAMGGDFAAGIGAGAASSCGNITISGGTVTAMGGDSAAGIGSGYNTNFGSTCGDITIASGVTKVTATRGGSWASSIGAGEDATCGTVTIEDGANVTQN